MKPFLKWAGGKAKLAPLICSILPEKMNFYFEPFVGAGAVFFTLARERRFKSAIITDSNKALIEAYVVVRDHPKSLINTLLKLPWSEKHYYEIRAIEPDTAVKRAARFIYLNKTCFNGLYRVNKQGKFNVPFGRYANPPRYCDEEGIMTASALLQGIVIDDLDFGQAIGQARKGDGCYMDPPYYPLNETSNFTAYGADGFGKADHERLAMIFGDLAKREVGVVLSNSDTPFTRKLYAPHKIRTVRAARAINSKAEKRGKISELLVVPKK